MNEEEKNLSGKCDQLTQPEELEVLSKYLKEGREKRDEHIIINQDNLRLQQFQPSITLPQEKEKLVGPKEVKDLNDYLDTLHDDREIELPEWIDGLVGKGEVELSEKIEGLKVDDAIKELPKHTDSLTVSKDIKLETKVESIKGAKEGVEKLESPKEILHVDLIQSLDSHREDLVSPEEVDLSNEKVELRGTKDIENLNQTNEKLVGPEEVDLSKERVDLKDTSEVEDLRQRGEEKLNTNLPNIYSVRDLKDLDQYYNNILNYTDKFTQTYPSASGLTAKIGSLISAYLNGPELDEAKKDEFERALFQTLLPILKSDSDWEHLRLQDIKDPDIPEKLEKMPGEDKITPLNLTADPIPAPTNEGFLDTGTRKNGVWEGITKKKEDDLLSLNTEKLQKTSKEDPVLYDWASSIGGGSNQVFVSSFSEAGNNNTLPPYKLGDFFNFWKDGKLNTSGLNANAYLRFLAENSVGLIPRSSVRSQRQARALALDEALALLVVARDELEKTSKSRRWRLPGGEIPGVSSLISSGVLSGAKDLLNAGIKKAVVQEAVDFSIPQNRPTDETKEWTPLSNKSEGTYYVSNSTTDFKNKRKGIQKAQDSLNSVIKKKAVVSGNIDKLKSKINEGRSKLNEASKLVLNLQDSLNSLKSKQSALRETAADYASLKSEATSQLSACNEKISTATDRLNEAVQNTNEQQGWYDAAVNENNEYKNRFNEWQAANPGKDPSEWSEYSDYNESALNVGYEKTILEQNKSLETDARNDLNSLQEEKSGLESDISSFTGEEQTCTEAANELNEPIEATESELSDAIDERDGIVSEVNQDQDTLSEEEANENELTEQEKEAQATLEQELDSDSSEADEDPKVYAFNQHYLQGSGLQLTLKDLCNIDAASIKTVQQLKETIISSPFMFSPNKMTSTNQDSSIVSTLDVNNSWEVILEPYYGYDNGATSFLPHIEEINYINRKEHGIKTRYSSYLPITGFDLTKEEYTSKEIGLYSGSFAIPDLMTYRNELRLSFVDDQYKSLRRYFELCAKASTYESNPHIKNNTKVVTEIDKNYRFIAPYRNVTFRCIIYSMTPQKSTINKYDLLLVMLNMSEVRSGDIMAGGQDLTVGFSIVGENPILYMSKEDEERAQKEKNDFFSINSDKLKNSAEKNKVWKENRFKSQKTSALSNLANSGIGIIT